MADNSALEARLQRLEDMEAIHTLLASYGPLADAGRANDLAQIWSADGIYDVGGFGVAKGRDQIAGLIENRFHRDLMAGGCAHILSPHHVTMTGDDSATATGYSILFRELDDGFTPWRVSANRWHFARQADGAWLAISRINRPLDGGDEAQDLLGMIQEAKR